MVGIYGQPIDEAIVGSGPFVMNNDEEIRQAIADYQSGKDGAYAANASTQVMRGDWQPTAKVFQEMLRDFL